MTKYDVYLETRKQGAIGSYSVDKFTIEAEREGKAVEIAGISARNVHGLETRFPIRICLHETGENITNLAKLDAME
jgi:hypothetical protein